MDKFKEKLFDHVAIGGLHCPCCNQFRGTKQLKKNKRLLNRRAKSLLKVELRKEIIQEVA